MMRESNCEANLAIFLWFILHGNDLDGAKQRHKPGVIVPGALVFRVCEVGML